MGSVSGEVVSVDKITDRGTGYGVSLTLKARKETILVYLGPGWYLERQDLIGARSTGIARHQQHRPIS